jgi:hypothetical protein
MTRSVIGITKTSSINCSLDTTLQVNRASKPSMAAGAASAFRRQVGRAILNNNAPLYHE